MQRITHASPPLINFHSSLFDAFMVTTKSSEVGHYKSSERQHALYFKIVSIVAGICSESCY